MLDVAVGNCVGCVCVAVAADKGRVGCGCVNGSQSVWYSRKSLQICIGLAGCCCFPWAVEVVWSACTRCGDGGQPQTLGQRHTAITTPLKDGTKLPIVYCDRYNITAGGIERLHPFDSTKYRGVFLRLVQSGTLRADQVLEPPIATRSELRQVHTWCVRQCPLGYSHAASHHEPRLWFQAIPGMVALQPEASVHTGGPCVLPAGLCVAVARPSANAVRSFVCRCGCAECASRATRVPGMQPRDPCVRTTCVFLFVLVCVCLCVSASVFLCFCVFCACVCVWLCACAWLCVCVTAWLFGCVTGAVRLWLSNDVEGPVTLPVCAVAAEAALTHGWAINLGGGFHHASADHGHGFCVYVRRCARAHHVQCVWQCVCVCVHEPSDELWCARYADITMAIRHVRRVFPALTRRVLIVDLDAHQGNGHERDFMDEPRDGDGIATCIVDAYNPNIFPGEARGPAWIPRLPVGRRRHTCHVVR